MKFYKVIFDDGNSLQTGFNGDILEAEKYYLNQRFELDEEKPMAKAISVEEIL